MRALSTGECMSVSKICELEQLPSAMTYKIIRKLEQAGMLESYRGSRGGYALKKSLDSVTLCDVCMVVMPEMLVFECMRGDYTCPKNTDGHPCGVHCEMAHLQALIVREMKKKPLSEIFA
jgi:Rrf2 family protein